MPRRVIFAKVMRFHHGFGFGGCGGVTISNGASIRFGHFLSI
jgi:hypothetical protein